jgi:cysteine-rich repeat protein
MIRNAATLKTLLSAMALSSALAVGCSSRSPDSGVVRLALHVDPNFTVNSVHWQINSSTTMDIKHGDIETSDINSTASVDTSCPTGSGYRVVMTATATDTMGNSIPCTGTSPAPGFNVTAGGSVMVGVSLICGGSMSPPTDQGHVVVNGMVVAGDNCPVVTSWNVSPLQTGLGRPINVSATATDADTPLQTLSFAWTADSGTFASPTSAMTTYNCGSATLTPTGARVAPPHTLTFTVSDSFSPPCTASAVFSVDCASPGECGDGIIEPGEQCDPPNGTTCSATCVFMPFCGDGIVEGMEQCDQGTANLPAGTTYGTAAAHCAACTNIPYCGDGVINFAAGETCDPPTSDGLCDANCHASIAECPGFSPPDQCLVCEQADTLDCGPLITSVPGGRPCFGCDGFPAGSNAQVHCAALLTCIRGQGCMAGDDPTPCLCGALSAGQCVSMGAPSTAACAAQYAAAAADFPATGTVFQQFSQPSTSVGIANNVAACRVDSACTVCP